MAPGTAPILPLRHNRIMPRLLLLIGLPGSGKSTLAAQLLQADPRRQLISTDAIRAQLFGAEAVQGDWLLIWREVERQLRQAVRAVHDGTATEAIYDATNVVRKQRRQAIALSRDCGFTHITGIWLNTPLKVCLQRNQARDRQVPPAVIDRMYRRLWGAPPAIAEGLDEVIEWSSKNGDKISLDIQLHRNQPLCSNPIID